jgi:hypothetical protein
LEDNGSWQDPLSLVLLKKKKKRRRRRERKERKERKEGKNPCRTFQTKPVCLPGSGVCGPWLGEDLLGPHAVLEPVDHLEASLKGMQLFRAVPSPLGEHSFRSPLAVFEACILAKECGFSGCVCER